MQARVGPPDALRVAVLLGFLEPPVPVRLERDAGGKGGGGHVEVADGDDGQQDLAALARPLEGEEVDVEQQDRRFGKVERDQVEEDAEPDGLITCLVSWSHCRGGGENVPCPIQPMPRRRRDQGPRCVGLSR